MQMPPSSPIPAGGGSTRSRASSPGLVSSHGRDRKHRRCGEPRGAAGRRGEPAGTRLSGRHPPGPRTCVAYSVACVRFQNILPHPTPERAQAPSVKRTSWGAPRASCVTPRPRARPGEGEAGRSLLPSSPWKQGQAKAEQKRSGRPTGGEGHVARAALNKAPACPRQAFGLLAGSRSGALLPS